MRLREVSKAFAQLLGLLRIIAEIYCGRRRKNITTPAGWEL
jgi:hypothetical protein